MLSGRRDKGAPLQCNSTDRRARGRMAWWSKSKPKANADVAVEKYLEHCAAQGQRLEMLFKSKLAHYCDGHSGRPSLSAIRSEEHTSELQSLMPISYAVFCF